MNLKHLSIAACCLAPLGAMAQSTISGSFTETNDVTAAYLVWADQSTQGDTFQAQEILSSSQTATAGTAYNYSVNDTTSGTPSVYTILAVYKSNGVNTGIVVGANTFAADFFLLGNPWPFSSYVAESDAMNLLLTDNAATMLNGLGVNTNATINNDVQLAGISVGGSGTLVNFSNGTYGGYISAQSQAVPEPATVVIMLGGIGALALRRVVR